MRRLFLFLGALGWLARLQMLVLAIILGYWIWFDIQLQVWPVTIAIVVFAWVIGRLMLPFMIARPKLTFRVLNSIGFVMLLMSVFAKNQRWWRTLGAHFGREFTLWLDLSCMYWFFSEVRLRTRKRDQELSDEQPMSNFEDDRNETSDMNDENVYSWRSKS